MEDFELKFEDYSFIIHDFTYFAKDDHKGGYVNILFSVGVISGNYHGLGDFEYNLDEFKKFILELKDMYDFKITEVVLKDQMYGGRNRVVFKMNYLGRLDVSGDINEPVTDQNLHFHFNADQTSLKPFIDSMKWILNL